MEIIRKKKSSDAHPYIPELKELYRQGRISRREFLRNATLLGASMATASAFLAACAAQQATEAPTAEAPAEEGAPAAAPTEAPAPTQAPEPTAEPEAAGGGVSSGHPRD